MKKLIAISVMCALIVGAAFAETTLGGQIFVGGALLRGDNITDSKPTTVALGNDKYNSAWKVTFSEGSAGGRIRILGTGNGGSEGGIFDEWFGWWRPIPQLRIQIGSNQDGDFGTAQISGWGFTGENKNNGDGSPGNQGAMAEYNGYQEGRNHSRTTGWYAGTGGTSNLQFTINAVDNLTINLWFPWSSQAVGFTLSRFEAQLQYRIVDIGTFSLSYQSNTGYLEADPDSWWESEQTGMPKIYTSFYLTAIDNMGLDLGLAYRFPLENKRTEAVTNYPFEVGLGYRFGAGDFGFKLRASLSTGGSTKAKDADAVSDITQISASILPSYKIGTVTVFFYAGLGIQNNPEYKEGDKSQYDINESDSLVAWFVNPYVFIPAGGLRFKVGLQVWSNGNKFMSGDPAKADVRDDAVIGWSIPFGFYAYF